MGLAITRIFCIFIGLALCSEVPKENVELIFRSYFAFFIMIALDYSRMMLKGRGKYEKWLGKFGLVFSFVILAISILVTSKHLVLQGSIGTYAISSSETFLMLRHINIPLSFFIEWTTIITMFFTFLELSVPSVNRYSQSNLVSNQKEEHIQLEEKEKEKENIRGWFKFRKSFKTKPLSLNIENKKVSKSLDGGGK